MHGSLTAALCVCLASAHALGQAAAGARRQSGRAGAPATRQQQQQRRASASAAARLKAQVTEIAAGDDTAARREAVVKRLRRLGVNYSLSKFPHGDQTGTNVVATLRAPRGARKRLMLGAHYDRVAAGRGVVDNASGSAVVLELLAALKARPLRNYAVTAVFFDLEEVGLVGSKSLAAAEGGRHVPDVFVNFDVLGYGDTLWVMSKTDETASAASFRRAAADAGFALRLGPQYPPSDHLSFLDTTAETISLSLVAGEEIADVLKLFAGERPERMPRVASIIHTAEDTPDKFDAAAVARALPVVERALRLVDTTRR